MRTKQYVFCIVELTFALGLLILSGCGITGSSELEGDATAKLAFSNADNSARSFGVRRAVESQPSTFKMKLIAVYLSEGLAADESNTGKTSFIYLNNDCLSDIKHCDISGGVAEDGEPMDKIVENYFDFAQSSDEVNAELNAQERGIVAGKYKYVRLEFCKYNSESASNIQWGNEETGVVEFMKNGCTVNSLEMDPPLEVKKGDSITVTLDYSLENAIQTGADADGQSCVGEGSDKACFTLPEFTPSAQ